MKKNNPRIKLNITLADKIGAIESISSSYFTNGEYTPYYSEMAETIAIVTYFMEGIEFEENESVYNAVTSDSEIMRQIGIFYNNTSNVGKVMAYVKEKVTDKVDFIKEQIIHSHADTNKIIETCNVIIDSLQNFSKLNIEKMTKEDLDVGIKVMRQLSEKDFTIDDISKAIKDAVGFDVDKATAEIMDAKNAEIRELKKHKALWESRNMSSDKVVQMPLKK